MKCNVNDNLLELTDTEEIKELIQNILLYANRTKMHPEIFFEVFMRHAFNTKIHIIEPDFNNIDVLYPNNINNYNTFKMKITNPGDPALMVNKFINSSIDSVVNTMKFARYQFYEWNQYAIYRKFGMHQANVEVLYFL
ncbi:MAG: hypothetical protein QXV17_07460 [Candidatus Micrarchaeaceae archaeon]